MLSSYHFFTILIIVVVAYMLTYLFVLLKKIPLNVHRMSWNFALLASFLITGIIGLVLAFLIDQKLDISWYKNYLWLHVEFGIIMAAISLFHVLWHLKYYLVLFKNNRPSVESNNNLS